MNSIRMRVRVKVRIGNETFYVSENTNSSLISVHGSTDIRLVYVTVRPLTCSPVRFSVWVSSLCTMNKINDFIQWVLVLWCGIYFRMLMFTAGFVQCQDAGQLDVVWFSSVELKWPSGRGRHVEWAGTQLVGVLAGRRLLQGCTVFSLV